MVNWSVRCQFFCIHFDKNLYKFRVLGGNITTNIGTYPFETYSILQLQPMHLSGEWEQWLGSNLGGHVVWGLLLMEPSPAIQSLLSGLGEPIVVIHCSLVDAHRPQPLLLLLAHPCSPQGDLPFSWVCSTVARSNWIKSSIFKATAAVTSSPECWPSKAVAESSSMLSAYSPWLIGRVSSVSVPIGFLNNQSNFFTQSVFGFRARNHRIPKTR